MSQHLLVNGESFECEGEKGVTDEDIEDILSPESSDVVKRVTAGSMEELAVIAGLFPSRGAARRNGFRGPLPHGLFLLGTKRNRFWMWSPCEETGTPCFKGTFDKTP